MNEIICPHCKKAFKVDEAGFADIVKQVRDHEFHDAITNNALLLKICVFKKLYISYFSFNIFSS
jgi:hypothetical protein